MKKSLLIIFVSILLLVFLFWMPDITSIREYVIICNASKITVGHSENDVFLLLGPPDKKGIRQGFRTFFESDGKLVPNSPEEYYWLYMPGLTKNPPFSGRKWHRTVVTIWFDKQGNVVDVSISPRKVAFGV